MVSRLPAAGIKTEYGDTFRFFQVRAPAKPNDDCCRPKPNPCCPQKMTPAYERCQKKTNNCLCPPVVILQQQQQQCHNQQYPHQQHSQQHHQKHHEQHHQEQQLFSCRPVERCSCLPVPTQPKHRHQQHQQHPHQQQQQQQQRLGCGQAGRKEIHGDDCVYPHQVEKLQPDEPECIPQAESDSTPGKAPIPYGFGKWRDDTNNFWESRRRDGMYPVLDRNKDLGRLALEFTNSSSSKKISNYSQQS